MSKVIMLTGATDGIGLLTAQQLAEQGHSLLIHGRNSDKLASLKAQLGTLPGCGTIDCFTADLSDLRAVFSMADEVLSKHQHIDVLVNNAGVLKTAKPITQDNLDVRFVVNTIAPWILTNQLLPALDADSRVVNLSSAAQAPVNLQALNGDELLDDMAAYSQSKLALTMWNYYISQTSEANSPSFIAVNPGSLLASKMVKEGFGVAGKDLNIGADILCKAALDEMFDDSSGRYFDNDIGDFSSPHPDAENITKCANLVGNITSIILNIQNQI